MLFLFAVLLQTTITFGQNARSTSELFIEIPDRGNYVVYVDNEFAGSSYGRFRFYDIRNSFATVVVMKDNAELLRKRINVSMNTRLLASYSPRTGWRNIATLNLYDRGQYALDNWDRPIFNNTPTPGQGSGGDYGELMTPKELNELVALIKNASFFDERKKLIRIALKSSLVTTDQLSTILKELRYDSERLEVAKSAYPFIADQKNMLKLSAAFSSYFTKQDFIDFIDKQKS